VANFDGAFRGVTKGKLLLEVGDGKMLTILVNKKTEVMNGDKRLKLAAVAPGKAITVEAQQSLGELLAVRVRLRE